MKATLNILPQTESRDDDKQIPIFSNFCATTQEIKWINQGQINLVSKQRIKIIWH